jgi:hypothetical protein
MSTSVDGETAAVGKCKGSLRVADVIIHMLRSILFMPGERTGGLVEIVGLLVRPTTGAARLDGQARLARPGRSKPAEALSRV